MPQITTPHTPFKLGKATVYKEGKDITLIANGPLVYEALVAAKKLEDHGINAEVIDCPTVKPLDKETILTSVHKTRAVITAEEAQITGGLGGAVAELLSEHFPVPIFRIGVQDHFGESGTADDLMTAFHLKHTDIVKAAHQAIEKKR